MVCLLIILFITGFLHAEWYYTEIADLNATPERAVFYENKIFVGTDNGEIYKISPSSQNPVFTKVAEVGSSVNSLVAETEIYAGAGSLYKISTNGDVVVLSTSTADITSVLKDGAYIYFSDEYGRLWQFDEEKDEKQKIGETVLKISAIEKYENSIFAGSNDKVLWRFYETDEGWAKEKIYEYAKITFLKKSAFTGEEKLYVGYSDSKIVSVYLKNDWKKYPISWTSGSVNEILCANINGEECLYVFTTDGDIFEISFSSSGYDCEKLLSLGTSLNCAVSDESLIYAFTSDGELYKVFYNEGVLAGSTYKHSASEIFSVSDATTTYRNPVFPARDEIVSFYLTDSNKSANLKPVLYWKQTSTDVFNKTNFVFNSLEDDYSVWVATVSFNFSTGTIIEYYIEELTNNVWVVRSGDDMLSNTSQYAIFYSSQGIDTHTFKFMVAGIGNCFHIPTSSFTEYSSMRVPLYPVSEKITFFIGNQASGSGNYGNMTGGKINYKTGSWQSKDLEWYCDNGNYKYWKAELLEPPSFYYFTVFYDDHRTTFVYGDDENSYTTLNESIAQNNAFSLNTSTSFFKVCVSTTQELELEIFEEGTFRKVWDGIITKETEISLFPGIFEMIIKGENFKSICEKFSYPASTKTYTLYLSLTPHTINFTGLCEGDFSSNELVYSDSSNDSYWGTKNELHNLWISFDKDNLYLGLSGILEGNSLIVYFDCGDYFGSIEDASSLPWSSARNHKFPASFKPDYQFISWNFSAGNFYRILSTTSISDITSDVSQKTRGSYGNLSNIEIKIPFSVFYEGIAGSGIPGGAEIKVLACVTGGEGTSVKDSIPDQSFSFGGTFDEFDFTDFLVVRLDDNQNGSPDSGKIPAEIVFSTSQVSSSQEIFKQQDFSYRVEGLNEESFFFKERDLPLYVWSVDASSAVLWWRNSELESFEELNFTIGSPTFTFVIPGEFVVNDIEYYFTLHKGTQIVITPTYTISISTSCVLQAGSKEYFLHGLNFKFDEVLYEDIEFNFLKPTVVLDECITPQNSEISEPVPVELYEIKGEFPEAEIELKYFDETDEANLRAYFFDGEKWSMKTGLPDISVNKITIKISQQGKIGIFKTTGILLSTKLFSIIRPVFNPYFGEKIEFNFGQTPQKIAIEIYDLNGRFIKRTNKEFWDGCDENGRIVPSGVYIYRVETESESFWGMMGVWK